MSRRLKAYEPQEGYRFQLVARWTVSGAFEHLDYAVDSTELARLLKEYRLAFGTGWWYRIITLPQRFWPKKSKEESVDE